MATRPCLPEPLPAAQRPTGPGGVPRVYDNNATRSQAHRSIVNKRCRSSTADRQTIRPVTTAPDTAITEPDAVAWRGVADACGTATTRPREFVPVIRVGRDGLGVAGQPLFPTAQDQPAPATASTDRHDDRTESTSEADLERG